MRQRERERERPGEKETQTEKVSKELKSRRAKIYNQSDN
jgi:hypothetical protein